MKSIFTTTFGWTLIREKQIRPTPGRHSECTLMQENLAKEIYLICHTGMRKQYEKCVNGWVWGYLCRAGPNSLLHLCTKPVLHTRNDCLQCYSTTAHYSHFYLLYPTTHCNLLSLRKSLWYDGLCYKNKDFFLATFSVTIFLSLELKDLLENIGFQAGWPV